MSKGQRTKDKGQRLWGRKGLLFCLLALLPLSMWAQQMSIDDFKRLKRPIWNRSKVAVDKQKAIIDMTTTEKGFKFTADGKEAAEAAEGDGIITIKVPDKTRYITVKHEKFGQLTWRVPVKYLKRKKHYRATLIANDPTQTYKPQQQWVVMTVDPRDAIVTMDSTTTLISNGQYTAYLPLGSHTWQVEAPFYEAQADSFLLSDSARVNLTVKLQPAYSYVTVSTPWELGDIYIDGLYTARGSGTSRRLKEGQHRLSIFRYEMCIYDGSFTIGPAEKKAIALTDRDFNPVSLKKPESSQPPQASASVAGDATAQQRQAPHDAYVLAPVTLKAQDADTEIWVDRERVGRGQWSGQLSQGYHIVNTMKDSIESKATALWIVDTTPQQLDLAVPQSSMAILNIHSNVTGADIYINNVRAGTTPAIIQQLPADCHYTVTLRKEGCKDAKVTVTPKGNELTDVNIKMKEKRKK